MKYRIRCNPRQDLLTDDDGELYCRYHGKNYILEEVADPEPAADVVEEQPAEAAPEPAAEEPQPESTEEPQ